MRGLLGALQALLVLVYPLAVWLGMTRFSARGLGVLLAVLLLPGLVRTLWRRPQRLLAALGLPLTILGLAALSAAYDDARFLLAWPTLVSAALLAQFGLTLRRGSRPMVERLARLQVDDLTEAEQHWCRQVTLAWCVFFVANGAASALLAAFGSREAWALYTGLLAYGIIGGLFAVEYTIRKYRFGRFGPGLIDRILARLFLRQAAP